MKVLVLDLDDTLYDERLFVTGGLRAAARWMEHHLSIPFRAAHEQMQRTLEEEGRGKVFDRVLSVHGALTQRNVAACVAAYRSHSPVLHLYPDAERLLRRCTGPIYVVTDGNVSVQRSKARALKLRERISALVTTWQYGRDKAKPSVFCFLRICERERVSPQEVMCIGDDPHKDFIGITPLGFQTVRIHRGRFKHVRLDSHHEAQSAIQSLDEIPQLLRG